MKIVSIIGTRPQCMKLDKKLNQVIVDTGQHYSDGMRSKEFFKELDLPKPNYELKCRTLTSMLTKILAVLRKEKPSVVQVFGDTRSTLAGALAASELNIPIAHVEAGMRSYRADMPEERNRVVVDHLSSILLAPSVETIDNLDKERIRNNVHYVGNVMLDTFNDMCPLKKGKDHKKYSYLSIHRQENTESRIRLENIMEGLDGDEKIIFPCHPRTRKALKNHKTIIPKNVEIIDPVSYKENIQLISDAKLVITDSGGVQNEAYWMGVPCAILRRETEWNGAVEDGWAYLVDADTLDIQQFMSQSYVLSSPRPHMPKYGAKRRVREILIETFG